MDMTNIIWWLCIVFYALVIYVNNVNYYDSNTILTTIILIISIAILVYLFGALRLGWFGWSVINEYPFLRQIEGEKIIGYLPIALFGLAYWASFRK